AVGGIVEQCRHAYRQLSELLKSRGASLDSVIKTTEFISRQGLADYRGTAAVRREVFKQPFPAATGVVCEGFPNLGCHIAIEATARTLEGV
ncbi:MAG: Rid family hydrolase, partial [Proteobacteria bacterium]|nr:Rid family hydrolase [Pseudomonadota bacterium]